MRHNCPKCGNRFEGFECPDCGTIIETRASRQAKAASKFGASADLVKTNSAEKKKNSTAIIAMLILGAIFVLFVLWRNGVIGSEKYQMIVEDYFVSICERDFDTYLECMPERIADDHEQDRQELGYEKEEYMSVLYADYFDEFGESMGVHLEIGASSAVEQKYVDVFLASYAQEYGEELEYQRFIEVDVNAVFVGEKSSDTIKMECFLMKVGPEWYMVGCDYVVEGDNF